MRQDASMEEWGRLYEAATKLKEKKPWEKFWDMDLIGIQEGDKEDTVFITILGRGGSCYGIAAYEGYEGFNDYLLLATANTLNLSPEYAMFSQNNLTCYWGNREELTTKQREIIKELGYKYRGKNQWLYFTSYAAGYFPCNLDKEEVLRLTKYYTRLLEALEWYEEKEMAVDFENANMFLYRLDRNTGQWEGVKEPLPFTSYQYKKLAISNEDLKAERENVAESQAVLEVNMEYLGAAVTDKEYDRPGNPWICLVGDADSGLILNMEMTGPGEDGGMKLAQMVASFILSNGAPREIHISNVLAGTVLEEICELCGTQLVLQESLKSIDDFMAARFGAF